MLSSCWNFSISVFEFELVGASYGEGEVWLNNLKYTVFANYIIEFVILVASRGHEYNWGTGSHDGGLLDVIGIVNDYNEDSALAYGGDGGSAIIEQDLLR